MNKFFNQTILFFSIVACVGCKVNAKKESIHFEVVNSSIVSDSLSAHWANYNVDFNQWKQSYEQCMHYALFPDAFYLGLQENMGIGTISNQIEQNVNGKINVIDTSHNKKIFDLLAFNATANCNTKLNLSKDLQNAFYNELIGGLTQTEQYKYLAELIDTNQIEFKITTLIDYSIRPDSLVSILQRTEDSSLLHYKEMLTTQGNALLVRAAMIFGFYAEFHLKRNLSPEEISKFQKEVFFTFGNRGANGSIKLLSNQNLQVFINKPYTVLGQFYTFKEAQ